MEVASILGAKIIVVHPIKNSSSSSAKGYTYEPFESRKQLYDTNIRFFKELIPYCEKFGIRIAIENMWQRHPITGKICDDVCAPPEELARYYDTLARPDVFTVCLDLGHVALCGREPEDAVRIIGGERIGCIHAHDVDYVSDLHTLPGTARIKWDNVCRALAEINYKGSFNLEADSFFTGLMPEQHEAALSFMNTVAKTLAQRVDSYRK